MASTLSTISIGLTVNSILFNTDAVFANFKLAERAEELHETFYTGRLSLQTQAANEKRAVQDSLVYNGDLAEQFRAAYLLETLAAVQTQRAYADGIAATFQLSNPLELVNWLRGEDWKAEVRAGRALADQTETQLLDDLGAPAYLDTAVALALNRTPRVASEPNSMLAKVGDDIIVTSDFWKRVYLEQYQLQKQLDNLQQLEKQFGDQGFFIKQIDQIQTTLSSPLVLGTQVLNQMIEEKVITQQTAKRGVTVSSEEIDEALREEIANSRGSVTKPQATATAQVALEATATAASWTSTPTPTVDPAMKASVTPSPTLEPFPTRPILTNAEYSDGIIKLQENLGNIADISMNEYREIIRARLLSEKLSELIGQEKVPSTEEQVHVRHILLRDDNKAQALTRAKELRQRILSGEDFSMLATKYSSDTGSALEGGDLGWFGRGRMVLSFEVAAFSLEVGGISEPVETEFGFHLIEVLEKDKNRPKDQELLEWERSQAYEDWLQEQIAATPIERPDDLASELPDKLREQ